MNSSIHHQTSFKTLLSIWSGPAADSQPANYSEFIQRLSFGEDAFSIIPVVTYVMDVVQMKYLYMSKNVVGHTGYPAEEFLSKGCYFTYSLMHPDDRTEFVEKVQKEQAAFLRTLPPGDHGKYRFSYTYRLRRVDGTYIQVLQQSKIILVSEAGDPLLMLGVSTDITHLKKDNGISLSIARYDKGCIETEGNFSRSDSLVSPREREVLTLIVEGKSTQEIAQALGISSFTVKNHRRNMMEKTGAKNMAEVIKLAFLKGLFQ
jgi:DNA-binding CsgD family transcriptional regulator